MQTSKIAVAGATGRVGRHIVDVLRSRGQGAVAIARSRGVDVISRKGLEEALADVECVIDATSSPTPDQKAATEFFTAAARNLQEAGERAGVRRMLVLSIIGVDKFTAGYLAAKLVHERAVTSGPIPVQIVRAAQFHELIAPMIEWGKKGDVSYVPEWQSQLVAARAVAEEVAGIAIQSWPAPGSAPAILEIAGPRQESLADAARRLVARRAERLRIEGVSDPNDPDRAAYESGAQLPGPRAKLVGPTFQEWLDSAA